jgi:type VI secretion system secreted protein Hcp
MACNGTAFSNVNFFLFKTTGAGDATGGSSCFLRFDFKLAAVKTISWSHDDESPKETVTFEFGAMQMRYAQQDPSGKLLSPVASAWSRVNNNSTFSVPNLA